MRVELGGFRPIEKIRLLQQIRRTYKTMNQDLETARQMVINEGTATFSSDHERAITIAEAVIKTTDDRYTAALISTKDLQTGTELVEFEAVSLTENGLPALQVFNILRYELLISHGVRPGALRPTPSILSELAQGKVDIFATANLHADNFARNNGKLVQNNDGTRMVVPASEFKLLDTKVKILS